MMNLLHGKQESCILHDVLLVPDLAYNLISVTAASKRGKVTTFSEMRCEIRDSKSSHWMQRRKPVLSWSWRHQVNSSSDCNNSKETIWHCCSGHLGSQGMQLLARKKMVSRLDFDGKQESSLCEPCIKGKSHRLPFQNSTTKRANHPLKLIQSDMCGKIGAKSLRGANTLSPLLMTTLDMCWSIS